MHREQISAAASSKLKSCLAVLLALCATFGAAFGQDVDRDVVLDRLESLQPGDTLEIPGSRSVPASTRLEDDFPLPGGVTYPGAGARVPSGTTLEGLDVPTLRQLDDTTLFSLLARFAPAPPQQVPADPTYTILIEGVDTSEFPEISLRMKIIPKDIATPSFDPSVDVARSVQVLETVLGETREAAEYLDDPPITLCGTKPVILGVAIDTSCSVQGVVYDMKAKMIEFVDKVLDPGRAHSPEDAISLYAFDGAGKHRAPVLGSQPPFASVQSQSAGFRDEVTNLDVDPPCLWSPIFESMEEELRQLSAFRAGEPDIQRVLVTFADFEDTGSYEDQASLERAADSNDVYLVNLGFGRVALDKVTTVTQGRGSFVQNASDNAGKALEDVYDAMAYTYCLRYRTPFPNRVNEVVSLTVTLGDGSTADARYPLPFVIPEDSIHPRLFLPVTDVQYNKLVADPSTQAHGTIELVNHSGEGPPRHPGGPYLVATGDFGDYPDLGKGFFLDARAAPDLWGRLFRTPTDFLDRDPDSEDDPVIKQALHYRARVFFRNSSTTPGTDGKPYGSLPMISVEDRTPPHLWVELRPADGRSPGRLHVREQARDESPYPMAEGLVDYTGMRIESASLEPPGFGAKRGRVDYRWWDEGGGEISGRLDDQRWSGEADGDGVAPAFSDDGTASLFDPESGGITLRTGTRLGVEVRARDNVALLEETDAAVDRDAFLEEAPDPDVGPVHARFDLGRVEAQRPDFRPPFLPTVPREHLRDDPRRAGLAWWVESHDPGDRYDGVETLDEYLFKVSDEEVRTRIAIEGGEQPDGPVRSLEIRAQDGRGNVTRMSLPIYVDRTSFRARRLQHETRRQRGGP